MITTPILGRFYTYQKHRFPLITLSIGLLPAILSTGVIVAKDPALHQIIFGLIASMSYLLHVRIIDEKRDFLHDSKYHKTRPLQIGTISMKELQIIDIYAVGMFLTIAIFAGIYPLLLGLLMLGYSYVARYEFFLGEKLRQHFFLYNIINTNQSFMMQLFVYSYFAGFIPFTILVLFHFVFTSIGTIIFEFVRKLKIPGKDGAGEDTYTWYLGFHNAIIIYIVFVLLNTIFFYQILATIIGQNIFWLFFSAILFCIALLFALMHLIKKTIGTEKMMQLSFIFMYASFNLIIFLSAKTSLDL